MQIKIINLSSENKKLQYLHEKVCIIDVYISPNFTIILHINKNFFIVTASHTDDYRIKVMH